MNNKGTDQSVLPVGILFTYQAILQNLKIATKFEQWNQMHFFYIYKNSLLMRKWQTSSSTRSVRPRSDDKECISSGCKMFAKTKAVFRDKKLTKFVNSNL